MGDILKTAHIHLDSATLRIHVKDSLAFNMNMMNEDEKRPPYIMWVGRSNDPEQTKKSILMGVCDGYDLEEIAEWVDKYDLS